MLKLRRFRVTVAVVGAALIIGLGLGIPAALGSGPFRVAPPPPPLSTPSPPQLPTPTPHDPATFEEVKALTEAMARETRQVKNVGGPVKLAGRLIQLPDDAYEASWSWGDCAGSMPCPKNPVITIARGASKVTVGGDGKVWSAELAPGEAGAFDFLKEALKAPIVQVPNSGTSCESAPFWVSRLGATEIIVGRRIQLPEDARRAMCGPMVSCVLGQGCVEGTVVTIARGRSAIMVDPVGNILAEAVVIGKEDAMDFVKEALR